MPKILKRIVALSLAPLLLSEPVTASTLMNPLSPRRGDRRSERVIAFQDQALMLPIASVGCQRALVKEVQMLTGGPQNTELADQYPSRVTGGYTVFSKSPM